MSFSSPSRSTVKVSVSPGWWERMETIRAMPSVTFWPSRATTTSPFSRPASSAGVSVDDLVDLGAGAVALAGLHLGADDRVARLAGAQDLVGGHLDLLDRDREADADVAGLVAAGGAAGGGDGGVDADDLAGHVDQRSAGVAGVDRGVGLDGVDVRRLARRVAGGDRPLERGDDARGHRGGEAQRGADGDDRVADVQRLRLTEGGGLQLLRLLASRGRRGRRPATGRRRWRRSGCRPGRRSRSGRRPRRPARPRGCW